MENIILLRYGEIWLKGNNKKFFENLLIKNIKYSISKFNCKFIKGQGRYYVGNYNESQETELIGALSAVFGLHSLSKAYKIKTDYDEIKKCALSLSKDTGTFRVTCKRADKSFPETSANIAKEVGGYIFNNKNNLEVDLHNPEFTIYIDIRENGYTYLYTDTVLCAGGLPVGASGHGLLMLSGGIDSPVAGYQMAKRGMQISAIHFHSAPYTSEAAKQKIIELAKIISKYTGPIQLYIVPFTNIQLEIHKNGNKDFTITTMRRVMVKIAREVAKQIDAQAIITGESLGQVASQTVQSITSTQDSVSDTLIFRPLISFDKLDTIKIAEKIGTYETSILPYEDCCTIFLPKTPVIKPRLKDCRMEESKLSNLDEMIKDAIERIELVKI